MCIRDRLYTLADILGEPITEQEAQNLIRKETNSDEQTFQNYVNLNETYRNKLLHFIDVYKRQVFCSLKNDISSLSMSSP